MECKQVFQTIVYVYGKSDELNQKYLKRRRQPGRVKKQIRRLQRSEGNKVQILQTTHKSLETLIREAFNEKEERDPRA